MPTVYDVDISALNGRIAAELKKKEELTPPEWAAYVKTGNHKERPPMHEDWWYARCAALLISIYRLGPIGVSKLRTKYGGRKNRGHKPDVFRRGSGSVIRKALQQLQKANLIALTDKSGHKGRIVTPAGRSFVDKLAGGGYIKASEVITKESTSALKESEKSEPQDKTQNASQKSDASTIPEEDTTRVKKVKALVEKTESSKEENPEVQDESTEEATATLSEPTAQKEE